MSCPTCGKPGVKRTCADCVTEFSEGVSRARQIWEYSEPRILAQESKQDRDEGYNLLLFNLFYCTRYSEYRDGERVRSNRAPLDFQSIANTITTSRSTINNNRYLFKRYLYLVDAGYIHENPDSVTLGEHDPYCGV